ncbi:hypothetical protein NL676_025749 [Syzygium grande]|nr:hypothetical protein NL676_025749 [Syzygium grande]
MMVTITILNDIYDVRGTLEELELFAEAIERWDVDAKEGLPKCMQVFYKTLLDLYNEIGCELTRKGRSCCLFFAKEAMKIQVRAYLAEAKWLHQGHVPTMEEYMPIALTTIGCELTFVTAFLGTGDVVTKDDFDWLLFSDPKIVKASQVICRLMNDIAGHKGDGTDHYVNAGSNLKEYVTCLLANPLAM